MGAAVRRRYLYRLNEETGQIEAKEVSVEFEVEPRLQVISDSHYEGLRSTDGVDLSTRKRHRAYMRATGTTLASDFKDEWAKAAERRAALRKGEFPDSSRREDLARALYETRARRIKH